MGEGRDRNENHLKQHTLNGKTPQAEGLQNDNGKVPLHAHSTGAPNLTGAEDPGSSWSPPGSRPSTLGVGPSGVAASLG